MEEITNVTPDTTPETTPETTSAPVTTLDRVMKSLETVNGYLRMDGGSAEFVDMEEDGTVKIKLAGMCAHCPMSMYTVKNVIEQQLKKDCPEVTGVINI